MSYYEGYEPILNRNLQELRKGSKNVNHFKKIKVFDSDVLAGKLQRAFRYDPDFAIESLKFSHNGYYGRSKYVQQLWQKELLSYNSSVFAQKPAYKSFYCPTLFDCWVQNSDEYFTQYPIEDIVRVYILQNFDSNISGDEVLNNIKEDIIQSFLHTIYVHIAHIAKDPKNNGEVVVMSLPPIRYDEDCPSCFSVIQDDIPLINAVISDYCSLNNIRFVNTFPYFADKDGKLREDLSDDGLFLNDKGYEVLTNIASTEIQTENQFGTLNSETASE